MSEKKIKFNDAIKELEEILKQIESGELDVDELSGKVKRASELITFCQNKLRDTEKEVDKIIEDMS
jgi:exodeoxyribonuclease VII small subunit